MAKNKMSEMTREKLLAAAREEFLENGYEKAKVESIAERAGVNKVMVYYHFDSKENILRELIYSIIDQAKIQFAQNIGNLPVVELNDRELIMKKITAVMGGNIELIKLIAIEVFKGNIDIRIILDLLGDFYEILVLGNEKETKEIVNWDEFFVKMLFFQGFPMIFYFIFSEQVSDKIGIDPEKLNEIFSKKFAETLSATIRDIKKQKKTEAL
jgi:AcrR family transcriptional regulator